MFNWLKNLFKSKEEEADNALKKRIALHEGRRNKLYKCTAGKWTIGVGHNVEDKGLPDEVIDLLFEIDLKEVRKEAAILFSNFEEIDKVRQGVLVEMIFQMGRPTLAGFLNFRRAISQENYQEASRHMLDSKWAKQDTPARAERLAKIMQTGKDSTLLV